MEERKSFDEIAAVQNVSSTFAKEFDGLLTGLRLIWWAIGKGKVRKSNEYTFSENDLELIEPQKVSDGYKEAFQKSWERKKIFNPMGILINGLKRTESDGYIKLKFSEKGDIKFSFILNFEKWLELVYAHESIAKYFENVIETTVSPLTIKEAKKYAKKQTNVWAKNEKHFGTKEEEINLYYDRIYKSYYIKLIRERNVETTA